MIVKGLKLHNIRSHRDTELVFDRGITVFTGRTGSGKSSIMMGITYALFGSEARIPNSELLRRGSRTGHVELEFEHGGSVYVVRRGLKEQGSNVAVDPSNLTIHKDGAQIPLLARASDLNQKIIQILGYPKGVDPIKLFDVTTYSKQDEIRKLVEMKPTERQNYIDKLLQIQRYQTTWEGMKDVVAAFNLEVEKANERLKSEDSVKKRIEGFKERVNELKSGIESAKIELVSKTKELESIRSRIEEREKEEDKFKDKKSDYDALKAKLSSMEPELKSLVSESEALKKKIGMADVPRVGETDKLVAKQAEIQSKISFSKEELDSLPEKVRNLSSVGGKCPLCGSEITETHKKKIGKEYASRMEELRKAISKLSDELGDVDKAVADAKRRDELEKTLDSDKRMLEEKEKAEKRLEDELKDLKKKFSVLEKEVGGYDSKRLETLRNEFTSLSSDIAGIESKIHAHEEEEKRNSGVVDELGEELKEFEVLRKDLKGTVELVSLLSKLRTDIRGIREKVRSQFLADFKVEFQAKFEEIRQFEEDYSVDVKTDYEPIAYSQGEEVSVSTLSGGEKTSLALSYRLALADLAAQIGGVSESEVLMLDEPTTGFDSDDIRALPDALKNIKTIPQLIIVTHAEELKEAADYLFNVDKMKGVSKVEEVNL
jgi:exonuclease SbcC